MEKQKEEEAKTKENSAEKLKTENEELKTKLKYLYAEFDNYKKHVEKEKAAIKSAAGEKVVKELLPVIDDFERVLEGHKKNESQANKNNILDGVEMIYKNMMRVLEKEGLKVIEAKGKKFNPYCHEAVLTCKDEAVDDNLVVEEIQKGYMLNSNVIRTAKVKVNKRD